jgi:hypothetical protein
MDARLFGGDANGDPPADAASEAIVLEKTPRRPSTAYLLLGPPNMAGAVLHLGQAAFRRAVAPSGVARIRVRALYDLPSKDARERREIVVRLGTLGGEALALERIEVVSLESVQGILAADARLCGPDADPYPLAVSGVPEPSRATQAPAPLAPILSVRHSSDDLCVRFWSP